jgi:hypothetical protein
MVTIPMERLEDSKAKVDVIGKPVNLTYRGADDSLNLAFFSSIANGFDKTLVVVDSCGEFNFVFDSLSTGPFIRLSDDRDGETGDHIYSVAFPYKFRLNIIQDNVIKDSYSAKDQVNWEIRSAKKLSDDSIFSAVSADFYPTVSRIGENMASAFFPEWVEETRAIYTRSSAKWKEAENYARNFDWSSAQRIWLELTDSDNLDDIYAASYNIAVADEILGDREDGLKWVSFIEKHFPGRVPAKLKQRLQGE